MKNKLQLMFTFICLAMFAGSVYGQGIGDRNRPAGRGNYRITGQVYLPDGKPAKDVDVNATGSEFSGYSTRTDIDGKFVISGLSSGNYTVSVREKGYQTESEILTIPENTTSGQPFRMVFHLRGVGQPKQAARPTNANFANVHPSALAKYEEGMGFMTKNEPARALPLFDQAISADPRFAQAFYEKGAAHLKLKEYDKSTEAFVKAIAIKPDYLEAKYGYGLASFEKKNYEVAEAVFRDVLKQKNDMAEAHLNLGVSLYHLKNMPEAESELRSAVTMKGGEKFAVGHLYLGQILMHKKQNADAAAELQKYLDLAPKAPNAEKIKTVIESLKKQG